MDLWYVYISCIFSIKYFFILISVFVIFIFLVEFLFFFLGDAWVRSFYTVFERVPLKRIGFSKADHRYYEKNGCVCGAGEGPIDSVKPMEQNEREMKEEEGRIGMQREMKDKAMTVSKYKSEGASIANGAL